MDNNWSIDERLLMFILDKFTPGETILELGSGESTIHFASYGYNVITIEHDEAFVKPDTDKITYVHAPIELYNETTYKQLPSLKKRFNDHTGWYNREAIKRALKDRTYNLILVDGPPKDYGRSGFLRNLGLFNTDCTIIFDDMHRIDDLFIAQRVAQKLQRDLLITGHHQELIGEKPNGDPIHKDSKPFGVIW